MIRVAVMGCGKLGSIIARGIRDGKVENCQLVGVFSRSMESAGRLAEECGCAGCTKLEDLLALKPDYILEAATGEALMEHGVRCLQAGSHLICLSVGALSNEDFFRQAEMAAREHGVKLVAASGVIGGLDLAGAALMAGDLQGVLTKYHYAGAKSQLPERYDGSAREAIEMSPRHLNIAVAAGLACGSLNKTRMRLDVVPPEKQTGFTLELSGAFGSASICCNRAGRGPALAAYSALAILKRMISPIVY